MSARVAQARMSRGLAKPSLFKVEIPRAPANGQFTANDYLEYYCKQASIPGINHDVHIIRGHARQGVMSSQPYGVAYGKPLTLTIIERSDYHSYEQFQEWFSLTYNSQQNLTDTLKMRYRNEFTCPIILKKYELPTYNGDGQPIDFDSMRTEVGFRNALEINFESAYPSSISEIMLNTEARNSMVEYTVEFQYDRYDIFINKDAELTTI
jgi:hypothetical protein